MGQKPPIAPVIKQSIVALRTSGMTVTAIAEKFGLHRVTVSRVLTEFKRAAPSSVTKPLGDYKERLKGKAIGAVEDGLECNVDPYRRGGLGVQVLKGIGEFEGDRQMIGVVINLDGTRLAARYRNLEVKPEPEAEASDSEEEK